MPSTVDIVSGRPPRPRTEVRRIEIGKLFEKLPPHAPEAEAAVLGSMILDWKVCGEVMQILGDGAEGSKRFYNQAHSALYEILIELYDRNQSLDMVQLNQKLIDREMLEDVGGLDYVIALAEGVPSAAAAHHYATIVKEKAQLRQVIAAAGLMLDRCYNSDDPAAEVLDGASQQIFEIAHDRGGDAVAALKDLVEETYKQLEDLDGRMVTGIETGFFELDEMTNGLQKGEMIIIAARPSMGKTAFTLNIAEHIGLVSKKPVAVFSLEMSKHQLAQRLMSSHSGVDSSRIRRGMLGRDDLSRLAQSVIELSDSPIYIDDTPGLSLLPLRAKARRLVFEKDVSAIMIDYLQLMSAPGAESRQQEVSNLSRGLKALARELDIPVVCLSQLNRQSEARDGHRPRMSDLRESGSIEQDADVVMMLHRESYYHRNDPDWELENPEKANEAEIIIAKQRNGPVGTVRLVFDGSTTRFRNAARHGHGGGGGGGFE